MAAPETYLTYVPHLDLYLERETFARNFPLPVDRPVRIDVDVTYPALNHELPALLSLLGDEHYLLKYVTYRGTEFLLPVASAELCRGAPEGLHSLQLRAAENGRPTSFDDEAKGDLLKYYAASARGGKLPKRPSRARRDIWEMARIERADWSAEQVARWNRFCLWLVIELLRAPEGHNCLIVPDKIEVYVDGVSWWERFTNSERVSWFTH